MSNHLSQPPKTEENKITLASLGEITQKEVELLYWIRKRFRYGQLIIETRDGQPYRIAKATEYQTLE